MTHRPIAPIEINGFTPGGVPSAYPVFEDVDPATLLVDESYQRDSSERSLKLVRKIIAGWDWAKFKPPVAVLTEAGLELIDGQHTSIAAATHPDIKTIPVMIVEAKQREARAGAFISHNRDRVAVTTPQLHIAALAAGDADARAIAKLAEKTGVTILKAPKKDYAPGDTLAITAIGAMIREQGQEVGEKVLRTLVAGLCTPITQLDIKAAALLLYDPEYAPQVTETTLAAVIQTMAKRTQIEVDEFRAAHPSTPAWKARGIVWFKHRRDAKVSAIAGQLKIEPSAVPPSGDLKTVSGKLIERIERKPANPIAIRQQAPPRNDNGKIDSRPN